MLLTSLVGAAPARMSSEARLRESFIVTVHRSERPPGTPPFAFDAVYGAFSGRGQIDANGKQVVAASAARYIARICET